MRTETVSIPVGITLGLLVVGGFFYMGDLDVAKP